MKKLIALVLAIGMCLALVACGGGSSSSSSNTPASAPAEAEGEKITINIGHFGAETTAVQAGALAMKDFLEGQGNFVVNVYPNNSMGSDDELCQMVQKGNIQMTLANSIIVNYVPDAAIYDTFYNFNSIEDVKAKFMEDDNFLSVMQKVYAEKGFYIGGWSVHGFRVTTANKPVYSPDDLKGLTFRVMQNDFHIEAWQNMGATPTPFSFSELYTALQQGTLDAQENPVETIMSAKLYEQQEYISKTNHLQQTQQWLMNLDFYNNLSDENKALVDEGIQIGCQVATDTALNMEAEWSAEIEEYGCTFVELTEEQIEVFRTAVAPEWESVKAKVSPEVWEAYTK